MPSLSKTITCTSHIPQKLMELTRILNQTLTYISSYALRCAVDLDISGRIKAHGSPMPLAELARSIPIPPEKDIMLGRLMGLLVQQGIYAQSEAGYKLTTVSELLIAEGSDMDAYVRAMTEAQFAKHWCVLGEWFKDSGRSTVFEMANDGKKFWDILKERPETGNMFNEAMANKSKQVMRGLVANHPKIFDGLNTLVDVGGGTGTAVKIIADAFPWLGCTLFDLPHVVAKALKSDSFNVVGGDMFEKIPPADAILFLHVLHDWSDEDCVRILKRCKEAIESSKENCKVIVVDIITDLESNDPKAVETTLFFDFLMMSQFGAKERNKQEWHDIILDSGFSGYKIYPARLGIDSVIEIYP